MRNFNIGRDIDLKTYLRGLMKEVREMNAIMEAETPEIRKLWQAAEDCMNDQFISEESRDARRRSVLFPSVRTLWRTAGCAFYLGIMRIYPIREKPL